VEMPKRRTKFTISLKRPNIIADVTLTIQHWGCAENDNVQQLA